MVEEKHLLTTQKRNHYNCENDNTFEDKCRFCQKQYLKGTPIRKQGEIESESESDYEMEGEEDARKLVKLTSWFGTN